MKMQRRSFIDVLIVSRGDCDDIVFALEIKFMCKYKSFQRLAPIRAV